MRDLERSNFFFGGWVIVMVGTVYRLHNRNLLYHFEALFPDFVLDRG